MTNVGNEFGQVLINVLTASEGSGLTQMTTALVDRYKNAGVPPLILCTQIVTDVMLGASKLCFQIGMSYVSYSWCGKDQCVVVPAFGDVLR